MRKDPSGEEVRFHARWMHQRERERYSETRIRRRTILCKKRDVGMACLLPLNPRFHLWIHNKYQGKWQPMDGKLMAESIPLNMDDSLSNGDFLLIYAGQPKMLSC